MRTLFLALAVLALAARQPVAAADGEEISGIGYRAIAAAMPEFARKNLDITKYRIKVWPLGPAIIVSFIDANASFDDPHVRGNPGKIPGFEVELDSDLRLINAHFIR